MTKTLLLAADSVTIQKVVGITFANEDIELVTESNGDDALRRAREITPDLVLADVGMPGLDGYELCAAMRADARLASIPVLLLTGTFQTFDESRAAEVGVNGHISKPFEAQVLVDRVKALLEQAAAAPPAPPPPPAPALLGQVQAASAMADADLPNTDFSDPAPTHEAAAAEPDAFRFEDLEFADTRSSNSQTDLFGVEDSVAAPRRSRSARPW